MNRTPAAVFRTQYDTWLVAILAVSGLAVVAAVIAARAPWWGYLAPLALIAFVGWCMDTRYTFTATELELRSGPFRWRVPLSQVTRVSATRNPLSSPAWSLDRLLIESSASPARIMVSPSDRPGFLQALRARCPQAQVAV